MENNIVKVVLLKKNTQKILIKIKVIIMEDMVKS